MCTLSNVCPRIHRQTTSYEGKWTKTTLMIPQSYVWKEEHNKKQRTPNNNLIGSAGSYRRVGVCVCSPCSLLFSILYFLSSVLLQSFSKSTSGVGILTKSQWDTSNTKWIILCESFRSLWCCCVSGSEKWEGLRWSNEEMKRMLFLRESIIGQRAHTGSEMWRSLRRSSALYTANG